MSTSDTDDVSRESLFGATVDSLSFTHGVFMDKRSERHKRWERRVVRVRDGALEFFKPSTTGEHSSKVALSDVTGCVVSSLNVRGDVGREGCGIYVELVGRERGIFLCAGTPRDARAWTELFRDARVMNRRKSTGSPLKNETNANARARGLEFEGDVATPMEASSALRERSPASMDTRGRVLDTFEAMERAMEAKDELLAAEVAGRRAMEAQLRAEKKLNYEAERAVTSMREQLAAREKELKLVRENLATEKEYSEELREQLDETMLRATEMEDAVAAAEMEIERLDRELVDGRATRERMETALMSEGDYLRQREAQEFQRQRQLETQLAESRKAMDEMTLSHERELAEARRRASHAQSVASATEQELLLSRDRLLSELTRMRREGYESVTAAGAAHSSADAPPRTPSRTLPNTPSRLGHVSPRRVTFKDSPSTRRENYARETTPRTPRSFASHPEPEITPERARRTLFGQRSTPGRHLDANAVIDSLDSPGAHGCRMQ